MPASGITQGPSESPDEALVARAQRDLLSTTLRLGVVEEMTRLIGAARSTKELVSQILTLSADVLDAEAASVLLADPTTGRLHFVAATGAKADALLGIHLERGEGVAGWVARTGQGILVPDTAADPRFSPRVDALVGFYTRSIACVPMLLHDSVIGVLEVINHRGDEPFTEEDLDILGTVAHQAALLVENSRLVESLVRRNKELQTLQQVAARLSSTLELSELLTAVISASVQVLGGSAGSLLIRNPETGAMTFEAVIGEKVEQLRQMPLKPGEGIAGWVVEKGVPLFCPDVRADPRFSPRVSQALQYPTHSLLAVPLKVKGEVIGVIEVLNLPVVEGEELKQVMDLAASLASQAAMVVENARLYRQLEQKADRTAKDLLHTNRALAQEQKKLETIIGSMADGVLVTDQSGNVLLVNPQAERLLLAGRRAVGQNISSLVPNPRFLELFAAGSAAKPEESVQIRVEQDGEARILSVRVTDMTDEKGEIAGKVVLVTDVTEQVELDTVRTELVSIASHELRAPLTAIKAFTSTMRQHLTLPEDQRREFLEVMDAECMRLNRLVLDLLDLSRIERGHELRITTEPVRLADLVPPLIARQALRAPGHVVSSQFPPDLPPAQADRGKVEQILVNLLDNAIKYTPRRTHITVSASPHSPGWVAVSVSDNGPGIPPEHQPYLFEKYARAPEQEVAVPEGLGLGLYLVRHLVHAHGGQVWVESQPGRGTTFVFTLPEASQ